ncbi:MAG: metallophosphoesterase [Synergistaceae bacterium]|nr:metallophosphoesterase [Synergistaceae bacterium]
MKLIGLLFLATLAAHYAYVYFKLRSAVGPGWRWTVLYLLACVFLVMGSRTLWLVDLGNYPEFKRMLSWSVYMGLAFFFILFTAFLALDVLRVLARVLDGLFSMKPGERLASPKLRVAGAAAFALLACVYGWYEALNVRPTYVTVETERLPVGVERVRVAHITDVHLGWIVQEERLDRILDVVRAARPDVLVSTGDLVDGDMEFRDEEVALFRGLNLPLGMYAVTGNHEFHVGVRQAIDFKERAGMRVLRNEYLHAGGLIFVGMDDPSVRRFGGDLPPEQGILASLPDDAFVVLLKHQPSVMQESIGLFDLQLSGHTHGGQIWPFYWLTRMAYEYRPGLRALSPSRRGGEAYAAETSRESNVYVSNGAGTWGPPLRFFAPPEVVIIDIVRKQSVHPAS